MFGNVKPAKIKQTVTGCNPFIFMGRTFTASAMFNDTTTNGIGIVTSITEYNVVVTNLALVGVSITASQNPLCNYGVSTLTATPVNGGTSPTYQWYKNGLIIPNATNATYQINGNLVASGTKFYCTINSNLPCVIKSGANSNEITVVINNSAIPTINIATRNASTCKGSTISFSAAITNGGTTPVYTWFVNGVTIANSNNATFISSTLNNGDVVSCQLNSNTTCLNSVMQSNNLTEVILNTTPITGITGPVEVCVGNSIQLTASPSGGLWLSLNNRASVNTSGLVTGLNGSNGTLAQITYSITNTSGCVTSASYSVNVNARPKVPSIAYAIGTPNPQTGVGGGFCTNKTFTVVGNPTGGVWSSTGVLSVNATTGVISTGLVAGAGTLTYTIGTNGCTNSRSIAGNVVGCAARGVNNGQLAIENYPLSINLFPNPAHATVSLKIDRLIGAGTIIVTDLYGKQQIQQPLSMGINTINVASFAKGMYFVSLITSEGKKTEKLIVE